MYQLNRNLRSFWTTRKPYKILKGGRFSGKTHDAAGMAAFLARNYSLRFLCIRQFQNRISDSVYTVIKEKIEAAGWEHEFEIGVSSIRHKTTGSEFLFYGIARNLSDIKGTEGVDICWIEEGEGLTEDQWSVIDPTIRKESAEIWLLYNPRLVSDFVHTKLPKLLGDACIIRHINYDENEFLSNSAREKAERLKEADLDAYNHIYLGHALSDDDNVIIKRSWILACVDAHEKIGIKPTGKRRVGYDVADSGADKNATTSTHGILAVDCDEWKGAEDALLESCQRVYSKAEQVGASIVYDSIGVGAGCGSKFKELNIERYGKGHLTEKQWIEHQAFNAGGKVVSPDMYYDKDAKIKNKDHFSNIKAQMWWSVADRMRDTYNAVTKGHDIDPNEVIAISSNCTHIERLIDELSTPRRHFDGSGKVKVESKDDMAKRGIKSPNLADSFIMAYLTEQKKKPGIVLPS